MSETLPDSPRHGDYGHVCSKHCDVWKPSVTVKIEVLERAVEAVRAALEKLTGDGMDGTLGHHPDNPLPRHLRAALTELRAVLAEGEEKG